MLLAALLLLLASSTASAAEALIQDRTHDSQVFGETRNYRIFLPPDYATSGKRYPVIYWFHGWSERHNKPVDNPKDRNYDVGTDYGGDNISAYVGAHDVVVVKWDGYNPRTPDEKYPRPYNISPVETRRQFPLYFPELVDYIDANYRTIADREHRATAGLSMGGFMSFWVAGKYPDMISSASNFMGSSEFLVGPMGFPSEYRHDDFADNYDGVRTRLVTGTKDFIRFYHQQMIAIWKYLRPGFETEEFDFDHGTPGIAKDFDFHMQAFADPLPKPAVWTHADVYPNFTIWDWSVVSNRRQPGITRLESVSKTGFRSAVREWLPSGNTMPQVQLTIATPRLYGQLKPYTVTMVRLRDGQTRRITVKADIEGRLKFKLDGDDYEVGITGAQPEPIVTLTGYRIESGSWATAGMPVKASVRFTNKGTAATKALTLRWETPNPLVQIDTPQAALKPMLPGASAEASLAFTVKDGERMATKFFATDGAHPLPLEIPLFPAAPMAADFQIADGRALTVYQHAVETKIELVGDGNGDGRANAGERIAIAFPDQDGVRLAELFTNDKCVDNSTRVSDVWGAYDHVGASVKYSLPLIRATCPAGHIVQFMARVQLPDKPNHKVKYGVVQFAVNAPARSASTKSSSAAPARRPAANRH
jgi:S-formylglutathione hydrolase FrmB